MIKISNGSSLLQINFWTTRQDELIEILEDADYTVLIDKLLIILSPIYFNSCQVKKSFES